MRFMTRLSQMETLLVTHMTPGQFACLGRWVCQAVAAAALAQGFAPAQQQALVAQVRRLWGEATDGLPPLMDALQVNRVLTPLIRAIAAAVRQACPSDEHARHCFAIMSRRMDAYAERGEAPRA